MVRRRYFLMFICISICNSDFQIREANALPIAHTYTVMCVLPINLFNQVSFDDIFVRQKCRYFPLFSPSQQIFTFLWFWFVFVILLTLYDLGIWIYRLFFRRKSYIEGRLKVMDYEITQKWPFNDSCRSHMNIEDNDLLIRCMS